MNPVGALQNQNGLLEPKTDLKSVRAHPRADLGLQCEEWVAQYLECVLGWPVLARRVRYRSGEIDLIAGREGRLIFVEVKGRQSATFGEVAETLTPEKVRRLRASIVRWRMESGQKLPGALWFVGVWLGKGVPCFESFLVE